MKALKFLLFTVLLIGIIFLAFYLGVKTGSQKDISTTNTPSNISEENIPIENIVQNTVTENVESTNTTIDSEEDAEPENLDFSGKWNTVSAVDTSSWKTTDNLVDIFGTSYLTYGSYLQLNSDNTFLDAIFPVTSGESSTTGTYSIQNNYYQNGDIVIVLDYSDGKQNIFKIIYDEENIPSLMQDVSNGEAYQFNLERN